MPRDSDGEVSNHIVMARKKLEEKAVTEKPPKKKRSVSEYHFKFFGNNHNKKSLEGRFQRKFQTSVSGTELTIHEKLISDAIIFQKKRKKQTEHWRSEIT